MKPTVVPDLFLELAREFSIPVALALWRRFGGQALVWGSEQTQQLAPIVGAECALAVARILEGRRLSFALGWLDDVVRDARVFAWHAADVPCAAIAAAVGVSERQVRRVLRSGSTT